MFKLISINVQVRELPKKEQLNVLLGNQEFFIVVTSPDEGKSLEEYLSSQLKQNIQKHHLGLNINIFVFNELKLGMLSELDLIELHREMVWILEEIDDFLIVKEVIKVLENFGFYFNEKSLERIEKNIRGSEKLRMYAVSQELLKTKMKINIDNDERETLDKLFKRG